MTKASLVVTSLLAENAEPLFVGLAESLALRLGAPVGVVGGAFSERRRGLIDGRAHVAGLCGALYLFDRELHAALEPVAAPVPAGRDGASGPVYYTDVVVTRDHPASCFGHLRGSTWAYNEPASHSGYHVVRAHLAALGERKGFFGRAVAAGSHQAALELVLGGRADAAPIDSYVLALERARRPELAGTLRVVERLGPSPAPPMAVARALSAPTRRRVREALVALGEREDGRRLLDAHLLARFEPVCDEDYAPLRRVAAAGGGVSLS